MQIALNPEEMHELMEVASGVEKADLVLVNGDLVNVYSGELLQNLSVAVKGKRIAYVGPDLSHVIGPDTEIIDAAGKVIIPGLVDGHTHMIWHCTPDEIIRYVAKGGTTTIVTEVLEFAHFGYSALLEYIEALDDQPIKIFATVPPAFSLSKAYRKRTPSLEQLKELLRRDDVLGVGEAYWTNVLRGDKNFINLAAEALKLGKTVEGHGAGCRERKLQAYVAHGVSSCHESVSAEEILEKLRLGVFVMVREGSVRKELEAISEIKETCPDFSRVSLVTDGVGPQALVKDGYLEGALQRAIDLGFDPILAIQMVTLNPARHFNLDSSIGGIGPGKFADIVLIPDLRTIRAECVISGGQVIAREGQLTVKPRRSALDLKGPKGIRVAAADLSVPAEGEGPFKVRVIDQVTVLVTREAQIEMRPVGGSLRADPEQDLLKVSLVVGEGKIFTGFVRGFGIKSGAVAASNGWETPGILCVGANEEEMAFAINRVSELGGGMVLYEGGKFQGEVPFPVGGLLSDLPIEEVAQLLDGLQSKLDDLGFPFEDIYLTLATLTTPAIPFLRISEDGLVDLKTGEEVDLIIC